MGARQGTTSREGEWKRRKNHAWNLTLETEFVIVLTLFAKRFKNM